MFNTINPKINWSNPLATGLTAAVPASLMGIPRDILGNNLQVSGTGMKWVGGWFGQDDGASFMRLVNQKATLNAGTILVVYKDFASISSTQALFEGASGNFIFRRASSTMAYEVGGGNQSIGSDNFFLPNTADGMETVVSITWAEAVGEYRRFLGKKGGQFLEHSATGGNGENAHSSTIVLGSTGGETAEPTSVFWGLVLVYDRVLTPVEQNDLVESPWQVFKPQRFYVPLIPEEVIDTTAPAGNTLTITLVDAAGNPQTNLTGISWAWFDESTVNSASSPTATGTAATTDALGEFSVDITGTTLTSGQTGMLALQDSTGYIYALYRVTLT